MHTPGQKGAAFEYEAILWALYEDYEVFKNVVPEGPVDLVLVNKETGEITLVDVKAHESTVTDAGKEYEPALKITPLQKGLGVKILWFNGKTFELK